MARPRPSGSIMAAMFRCAISGMSITDRSTFAPANSFWRASMVLLRAAIANIECWARPAAALSTGRSSTSMVASSMWKSSMSFRRQRTAVFSSLASTLGASTDRIWYSPPARTVLQR